MRPRDVLLPLRVELPEPICTASPGLGYVLAVGVSGALFSWGCSHGGVFGRGLLGGGRGGGAGGGGSGAL